MTAPAGSSRVFPLVGRATELETVIALLEQSEQGRGSTLILSGDGGIGKTRLANAAIERARQRGWQIAVGRAYPVETGVPYSAFSDAFLPLLRKLEPAALTTLSRGGYAELVSLFPALGASGTSDRTTSRGDSAELKTRLLWNFSQFIGRLASKQPLLIVLENLHWADASSLELLHFAARQISTARVAVLCTYNPAERDSNPTLRATEQSLLSLGCARSMMIQPLTRPAVDELVNTVFGVDEGVTREFSALLYGWTRGNPFFVDETLKALIEAGRLRQVGGTWIGWEIDTLDLPRSIREAVLARLSRLSPPARTVADLTAVVGTRATYEMLAAMAGLDEHALLGALDELRSQRILVEHVEGDEVQYDFEHPILRDTLYSELGRARARLHHSTVAEALEKLHGPRALEHADELAYHFERAGAKHLSAKALKYLTAAGRMALAKQANREAANYLTAALERMDDAQNESEGDPALIEDLARARQRLGEYDAAMRLLERARDDALRTPDLRKLAAVERRLGLACYWTGRFQEALEHYDAGLSAAASVGDDALQARLQLNKGICLQELGRLPEAKVEVEAALQIAERIGEDTLRARVQRSLLLLYLWTGPPELAREHGLKAIELADAGGHRQVAFQAHWGMAMLGGLTGDGECTRRHIREAERIAEDLRSPVMRIWANEISIEYASFTGDWDAGIALAERTISLARSLGRTLVPRLLVWSSIMYLGRGDLDRAKKYIEEAWELSVAASGGDRGIDVHTVVPAHTGLAVYHLATGNYEQSVRIGKAGLAIADSTGYVVWAIYRLLPTIAEASLWANDVVGAAWISKRLRRDSERLGQKLGLAWADACDALVAMLRGQSSGAVVLLRKAAEQLEAIPFVADAARLRRQLARALSETGDREGAMRELRVAHDVFAKLGAERELQATRAQLRELGARPPVRTSTAGAHGLTGREIEIVRLVAERKSNKEIGVSLGISSRTVSTHLSNVFAKLAVTSRGELTDYVRARGLPVDEGAA